MFKTMFTITLFSLVVSGCNWFQDSNRSQSQETEPANRSVSTDNAEAMGNKKCPPKSGRVGDLEPCELEITKAQYGGANMSDWIGFRFRFSEENKKLKINIREENCPKGESSGANCRPIPHRLHPAVKSTFMPYASGGGVLEYIYLPNGMSKHKPIFHCLRIDMKPKPGSDKEDFTFEIFHVENRANPKDLTCVSANEFDKNGLIKGHDRTSDGGRYLNPLHDITSGGGRYIK